MIVTNAAVAHILRVTTICRLRAYRSISSPIKVTAASKTKKQVNTTNKNGLY